MRNYFRQMAMVGVVAAAAGCGPEQSVPVRNSAQRGDPVQKDVEHTDPIQNAADRAMKLAQPAVVQIRAVVKNYAAGREVKSIGVGSGFIITPDGDIVTNHHVAGRAGRLVCVLSDNEEVAAELIGTDPLADIAVLRLARRPGKPYPTVRFGDSDAVTVGETVLAMGSPLAMSQTTTRGVISNTKMIMPGSFRGAAQFTLEGELVGAMVRWFTHDAAIFPGNSGGPLLNLRGDVIGVNEISFGLGGAIPANLARTVSGQIMERGRARRAWLGLEVQGLLKSSGQTRGVLVADVAPDSPAAQAGILSGDLVLRIGERAVTVRYDEEIPLFNQLMAALPIGQDIAVVIRRGEAEQTLTLRPSEREPMLPAMLELKEWGITVRDINAPLAQELRVKQTQGALVTSVGATGPSSAAKPALLPLDVIRTLNGQPVTSVTNLQALTHRITEGANAPVPALVEVERQGQSLLSIVKLGMRPPEPPGAQSRKAWLGIQVQAISREMAAHMQTNRLTGVRVTQVFPETKAETAGLQVGDLIVALDGDPVTISMPGEEGNFFSRIRQYAIGKDVKLGLLRSGQATNVVVTLDATPAVMQEMERFEDPQFEFIARDLTLEDRTRMKLPPDFAGAIVMEVTDGGWAALGGLGPGDLIMAVNEKPVSAVADLSKAMKELATTKPAQVVVRVRRGIHAMFIELEPEWPVDSAGVSVPKKNNEGTM